MVMGRLRRGRDQFIGPYEAHYVRNIVILVPGSGSTGRFTASLNITVGIRICNIVILVATSNRNITILQRESAVVTLDVCARLALQAIL